jgi:hypothetical protein
MATDHIEALKKQASSLEFVYRPGVPATRYFQMACNLELQISSNETDGMHDELFIKCVQYLYLFKEILRKCASPGEESYDRSMETAKRVMVRKI